MKLVLELTLEGVKQFIRLLTAGIRISTKTCILTFHRDDILTSDQNSISHSKVRLEVLSFVSSSEDGAHGKDGPISYGQLTGTIHFPQNDVNVYTSYSQFPIHQQKFFKLYQFRPPTVRDNTPSFPVPNSVLLHLTHPQLLLQQLQAIVSEPDPNIKVSLYESCTMELQLFKDENDDQATPTLFFNVVGKRSNDATNAQTDQSIDLFHTTNATNSTPSTTTSTTSTTTSTITTSKVTPSSSLAQRHHVTIFRLDQQNIKEERRALYDSFVSCRQLAINGEASKRVLKPNCSIKFEDGFAKVRVLSFLRRFIEIAPQNTATSSRSHSMNDGQGKVLRFSFDIHPFLQAKRLNPKSDIVTEPTSIHWSIKGDLIESTTSIQSVPTTISQSHLARISNQLEKQSKHLNDDDDCDDNVIAELTKANIHIPSMRILCQLQKDEGALKLDLFNEIFRGWCKKEIEVVPEVVHATGTTEVDKYQIITLIVTHLQPFVE